MYLRLLLAAFLLSFAPANATAALNVSGWGINQTVGGVLQNIVTVLTFSIIPVCVAIFTVGALLYTGSFGKEEYKGTGKGMMIGAVVGVAIVAASRGILALVTYFLGF